MKPTTNALYLVACIAVIGLLPIPLDFWYWFASAGAALLIADLAMSVLGRPDIEVARVLQSSTAIHRRNVIRLNILNGSKRRLSLKIFDGCPVAFNDEASHQNHRIEPGFELTYEYAVTPVERGNFRFESTTLIVRSLLHMWEFKMIKPVTSSVNVYPDFAAISRYLELTARERTTQVGIKLVARRGTGLEFEQLREYRLGDPINQLDWNATAKHQKLISREYQDERDQLVCILMDTGMTMRMKEGDLNSLDHALNALILLSYVALNQGDAIAVQFFGSSNKWIAPVKGPKSINAILNSVFDVQSGPVPVDYVEAAESLLTKQRKRAMVMLVTNARQNETDISRALKLLSSHHITAFVNLRDSLIDELPQRDIQTYEDALLLTERSRFLEDRRQLRVNVARSCHATIDCRPQDLLVQLLNVYRQIKGSRVL